MALAWNKAILLTVLLAWNLPACSASHHGTGHAPDPGPADEIAGDAGGSNDVEVLFGSERPEEPPEVPDQPAVPDASDPGRHDDGNDAPLPLCPLDRTFVPWVRVQEGPPARLVPDCPGVGLEVSFPASGVLRLRYTGSGEHPTLPYATPGLFDPAALGPPPDLTFAPLEEGFVACAGGLVVVIAREKCTVRVADPDGTLLVEDEPSGGYGEGEWGPGWTSGNNQTVRWVRRLTPLGERFYGLGEKAGYSLNRRGRTWTFWNSDHPAYAWDTDPLYVSIPFLVGLRDGRAYGVFMNNTHRQVLDLAHSDSTLYQWAVAAGEVDQFVFAGPTIAQVLERFTALTGRPFLPPRWSLGYHQSRWSYWPDMRVKEVCEAFRARDLPADGIWLDIDYMDGFRSWTWDPVGFPDPSGLVAAVQGLGFQVTAIIDPGLKVDPEWDVYQSGLEGGHFLGKDGTPFEGEVWPGPSVFPDFSRPATRAWWASLVPRLTDHGVWGIWLDMNEPASFQKEWGWTLPDFVEADGEGRPTTLAEIHNVYALVEAQATREGLLVARPDRRPFLLSRAGFAGIQRYAAVWTGDAASSFEALRMTLPMLLGLGLSGVPFVGSDVGGWTGFASPELFARWMALGSVSPFYRGHVQQGTPDQEPWAFGVEVEDISRILLKQRYRWLPYLYSLAWEASRTGAPILRPLVFEFQQDPGSWDVADQAMLGPWLMVAPVLSAGARDREIYFPPARFVEWRSGAVVNGPAVITDGVTLQALPTYLREGGIVPGGPEMRFSDEAPLDPLTLDVFPGPDETHFTLYEDDGVSMAFEAGEYAATRFTLRATETGALLLADPREGLLTPPARRVRIRVRPVDGEVSSVTLDSFPLPRASTLEDLDRPEPAASWFHDTNDRALVITFPDRAPFRLEMTYDQTLAGDAPDVLVPLRVRVPSGTPHDPPVHVATSSSGWHHQPLAWSQADPDVAEGSVRVPRGKWFEYKYTRGSWATVEKWVGCLEATNRYHFGQAHPVKEDQVEAWADQCR